jgi:hypothetical protein
MSYDNLLKWSQTSFNAATGHFTKVFDQLQVVTEEKKAELEVVSNFFNEFGQIESDYKDKLIEVCVKYQRQVYEAFSDEKMQQFFQMLFNNLLHRSDQITKNQGFFKDLSLKMTAMNQNFQKNIRGKVEMLRGEMTKYNQVLLSNKTNYSEYLRMCDSLNENSHQKIDHLHEDLEDIQELGALVQKCKERSDQVKLLDKVANFKLDIGKRAAQKLKDKFKEQRNKADWSKNEIERFSKKWIELKGVVKDQVKVKMAKIKNQEKAVISGTEKKIKEYSKDARVKHDLLSKLMFDFLGRLERSLQACRGYELDWKDKIKAQIVQFMCNYFPHKQDEMLDKAKNTEDNMEGFNSKFYSIAKVAKGEGIIERIR